MRKISVLGSTGSVGTQSLDVIEKLGLGVAALTANKSVDLLEKQARKFNPEIVGVYDEESAGILKKRLADTDIKVLSGMDGLIAAAEVESADTVITAVMGMIGLKPTMAAIRRKKRIGLANKETLVCAGRLVMAEAKKYGAEIVPVDSEHSAIFQSAAAGNKKDIKKILLTASGGPFRGKTYDEIKNMPKEAALKHPNWSMGQKITIDSASMMNKGLEFIEAMHLFSVRPRQIEVLVHPQSIIHSAVVFEDNSVIAQMGVPDMRIPIQYAITYPERTPSPASELDFTAMKPLTFEKPDLEAFPSLALAMEIAGRDDASCAVMNGANEAAVALYLQDKISFGEMYDAVKEAVDALGSMRADTIDDILSADSEARKFIFERYN